MDQNRQVPHILLVTSRELPTGEPRGDLVTAALARRGLEAAWVVWDDPKVDWSAADVVAVRSTWDYHRCTAEFFAWARDVESRTLLLNGAELFAWNADKRYLVDLDLPHVPTAVLDDPSGLAEATARWGSCVVKPRVGASGVGVDFDDVRQAAIPPDGTLGRDANARAVLAVVSQLAIPKLVLEQLS